MPPTTTDIILSSIVVAECSSPHTIDRQTLVEFNKRYALGSDVCSFQSAPSKMLHDQWFRECVDVVLEEVVFKGTDRKNKVVNWKSPDELKDVIDFAVKRSPGTHENLMQHIRNIVKYSVKTGHPYFMNQLFSR